MSKVNLKEWFLFEQDKIKLLLIIDMRVIVRILFKRFFPRMKNNFKDTSPKKPYRILKDLIKKNLYTLKYINYYTFLFLYQ